MESIKEMMTVAVNIEAILLPSVVDHCVPEELVGQMVTICKVNEVQTLNDGLQTQVTIETYDGDHWLVLEEDLDVQL